MGDILDKITDEQTRLQLCKELEAWDPTPFNRMDTDDQLAQLEQPEFNDFMDVLIMGAEKHGLHNWLDDNGSKSSRKDMFASAWRHTAEAYAGVKEDHESGLHPLKHAISRLQMIYTREVRGIIHDDDK